MIRSTVARRPGSWSFVPGLAAIGLLAASGCGGTTETATDPTVLVANGPAPNLLSHASAELWFNRGDLSEADKITPRDEAIAQVTSVTLHCSCGEGTEGACAPGATRSCDELVKIATFAPGDVWLDFVGEGERASAFVVVADPAALRLEVSLAEKLDNGFRFGSLPLELATDGAFEIPAEGVAVVRTKLYDAGGHPLAFAWAGEAFAARTVGASIRIEEGTATGPNSPGGTIITAVGSGESRVAVEGRNLSSDVRVRVTE